MGADAVLSLAYQPCALYAGILVIVIIMLVSIRSEQGMIREINTVTGFFLAWKGSLMIYLFGFPIFQIGTPTPILQKSPDATI